MSLYELLFLMFGGVFGIIPGWMLIELAKADERRRIPSLSGK